MDFYSKLSAKKRSWVEVVGPKDDIPTAHVPTLKKALALRVLEIPVGDWVESGLTREFNNLPNTAIRLLESNIRDEVKHDSVLNKVVKVHDMSSPYNDNEANLIAQHWLSHPDHPIAKAAVLESSVFFIILPMLRFLGGMTMRTVAADISNDETIHAATNRHICEELQFKISKSLNNLRRDTIEWLVCDLYTDGMPKSKWLNPMTWKQSSETLFYKGQAPLLSETKRGRMIAPFEAAGHAIPIYG